MLPLAVLVQWLATAAAFNMTLHCLHAPEACFQHTHREAAAHQARLSRVVFDVLVGWPCVVGEGTVDGDEVDAVEQAWLQHLAAVKDPVLVGEVVVLAVPWARVLACSPAPVRSLVMPIGPTGSSFGGGTNEVEVLSMNYGGGSPAVDEAFLAASPRRALAHALSGVVEPRFRYATVLGGAPSIDAALGSDVFGAVNASITVLQAGGADSAGGVVLPELHELPIDAAARAGCVPQHGFQGIRRQAVLGYCHADTQRGFKVVYGGGWAPVTKGGGAKSPVRCTEATPLDPSCATQLALGAALPQFGDDLYLCGSPNVCGDVDGTHAAAVALTLTAAEFFLCPSGARPACSLLGAALHAGAIPVYVWSVEKSTPYWFPAGMVWEDIAVVVHVTELSKLRQTLAAILPGRRRRMRAAGAVAARRLFTPSAVAEHVATWFELSAEHTGVDSGGSFLSPLGVGAPPTRVGVHPAVWFQLPVAVAEVPPLVDGLHDVAVFVGQGVPPAVAAMEICSVAGVAPPSGLWDCADSVWQALAVSRAAIRSTWPTADSRVNDDPVSVGWGAVESPLSYSLMQFMTWVRLAERARRELVASLEAEFGGASFRRVGYAMLRRHPDMLPAMAVGSSSNATEFFLAQGPLWRSSMNELLGIAPVRGGVWPPLASSFLATQYLFAIETEEGEQRLLSGGQPLWPPQPRGWHPRAGLQLPWRPGQPCVPRVAPPDCRPSGTRVLVLVWGTLFLRNPRDPLGAGFTFGDHVGDCGEGCVFTDDEGCLHAADAVVIADWDGTRLPPKLCGQLRVRLDVEAPVLSASVIPKEHMESYFDLHSSYHLDSDVPMPYFPLDQGADAAGLFEPPVAFGDREQEAAVAMVISNCHLETNGRLAYAKELMKHTRVHSLGKCLHNKDFPPAEDNRYSREHFGSRTMEGPLRRYKFLLVFENSNCLDYVTEKLWRAFRMGVVPVYMGAHNARQDFAPTPHAIITTSDFRSPAALAAHLDAVASNATAFEELLSYKRGEVSPRFEQLWGAARGSWQCRLCEAVSSGAPRRQGFPPSDTCWMNSNGRSHYARSAVEGGGNNQR